MILMSGILSIKFRKKITLSTCMKNSLLPELEAVLYLIRVYLTCQIAFWVKNFFLIPRFYLLSYYIFNC